MTRKLDGKILKTENHRMVEIVIDGKAVAKIEVFYRVDENGQHLAYQVKSGAIHRDIATALTAFAREFLAVQS